MTCSYLMRQVSSAFMTICLILLHAVIDHQDQAVSSTLLLSSFFQQRTDIFAVRQELHRVLRPGGKVAVLDFNNSSDPFVDGFQEFSLQNLVVPAAKLYGLGAEYEYLRPSIKQFATGAHLYCILHCFVWMAVDQVPCCIVIDFALQVSNRK